MPDPVIIVFDAEIQKLGKVKSGPVAKELVRQARRIRDKTKTNLGRQYPPAGNVGGYPARRTGRLQRSIKVSDPVLGDKGLLEVDVYTDAPHGTQLLGGAKPLKGAYVFITDKDLRALKE